MWTAAELDYESTLHNFQHLFNDNPRVKKLIKNWERIILLTATDTGSKYALVITDHKLTEVCNAPQPELDESEGVVQLQAEEAVLKQIFEGKYNPATALLDGALAVFSEERDKVKLEALAMVIWRLG